MPDSGVWQSGRVWVEVAVREAGSACSCNTGTIAIASGPLNHYTGGHEDRMMATRMISTANRLGEG